MRRSERVALLVVACLLIGAETPSQPVPVPPPEAAAAVEPQVQGEAAADADELAARRLELEAREAALRVLEQDLTRKIDELAKLREEAVAAITPAQEREKRDLRKLVGFYGAMKPQNAARLLEELPEKQAADVLGAMAPRQAGKILNAMGSERARNLSLRVLGSKR
jgi:flagellar motility protein MotE (MotC chaperone)